MRRVLLIFFAFFCYAQEKGEEVYEWDTGPTEIDVSSYPEKMQNLYEFFKGKCSQCHTIARPINAPYVGEEWKIYLRKMMRKPGRKISPLDAKKIYEFLVFDSKVRKKGKRIVEITVILENVEEGKRVLDLLRGLEGVKEVREVKGRVIVISDLAFVGVEKIKKMLKKADVKVKSIEKKDVKKE
jgi:hypothetical protein